MDLERWTKKTGPCTWGHGRASGPSEVRVGRLGEEEFALWELWLLPERPRRLEEPLGCARQDAGVRRAGGARGRDVTEAPDTAADGLSAPAFPVGPGVALSLLSCIHRSPNKRPLAAATPSSLALASTAGWRPTNQNPLPQSPALTSWPLLPWALPVRGQSLREDVGIPFARVPPFFPSLPKAPGRWRPSPHH